jgi:alkaline phosphatase
VGIWALGPGAERFAGVQDNTDIPKKIALLLDIRPFPRPVK